MDKLQKTTSVNLLAGTSVENEIARSVYRINLARDYPLSDSAIDDWAECIIRLFPSITPKILDVIIDNIVLSNIDFDSKLGIRDLITAIKKNLPKPAREYAAGHPLDTDCYRVQDRGRETDEQWEAQFKIWSAAKRIYDAKQQNK